MNFRAAVRLHGRTATGIEVPAKVVDELGAGKRPAVVATINGYSWRTSIGSMGGRSLLPVSAEVRTRSGISAGDQTTVTLELDTEPRTVDVPKDLVAALQSDAQSGAAFAALSPSGKRRHVLAVEGAKTPETRRRRIDKALEELRAAER